MTVYSAVKLPVVSFDVPIVTAENNEAVEKIKEVYRSPGKKLVTESSAA